MAERKKVREVKMPNGYVFEYYCTVGGPKLEQLVEEVYRIAARAILSKVTIS